MGDCDRKTFGVTAREVMRRLGLHTWEDVKEVVTDYYWIESVFGTRFNRLRVVVMG